MASQTVGPVVEIRFGDGIWMLATPHDLEMTSASSR